MKMYSSKSFLRVIVFEIFKSNSRKIENSAESNRNETCLFDVENFSTSKNAETK